MLAKLLCSIGVGIAMVGDQDMSADRVSLLGDRVSDQMSIFSAISIASSTSMPRYRTVLSIFE